MVLGFSDFRHVGWTFGAVFCFEACLSCFRVGTDTFFRLLGSRVL